MTIEQLRLVLVHINSLPEPRIKGSALYFKTVYSLFILDYWPYILVSSLNSTGEAIYKEIIIDTPLSRIDILYNTGTFNKK